MVEATDLINIYDGRTVFDYLLWSFHPWNNQKLEAVYSTGNFLLIDRTLTVGVSEPDGGNQTWYVHWESYLPGVCVCDIALYTSF